MRVWASWASSFTLPLRLVTHNVLLKMSAEVSTSPVAPEQDPEVPETSVKGADGDTAPAEATSNGSSRSASLPLRLTDK